MLEHGWTIYSECSLLLCVDLVGLVLVAAAAAAVAFQKLFQCIQFHSIQCDFIILIFWYCAVASIIASYLFTNFMHNVQSMILIVLCASCPMRSVCVCMCIAKWQMLFKICQGKPFPRLFNLGNCLLKIHAYNWLFSFRQLNHLFISFSVCVCVSRSDYPCLSVVYFRSVALFICCIVHCTAHSEKFMNYVWTCVLCKVRDSEENLQSLRVCTLLAVHAVCICIICTHKQNFNN